MTLIGNGSLLIFSSSSPRQCLTENEALIMRYVIRLYSAQIAKTLVHRIFCSELL